jgi:hypothetical protein
MSAAVALPAAGVAAMATINPMDVLMQSINTSPYFIGIMMLLLNLGGRFLALEITKDQEKFLSQPWIRRFFLFAVLFVATRNLIIAAGLTIIVILALGYLFNENSDLCLWRPCHTDSFMDAASGLAQEQQAQAQTQNPLTQSEQAILKMLQDKKAAAAATPSPQAAPTQTATALYTQTLNALMGK